jgi:acetolactate synthase-1/2/3 large subunit
VICIGTRLIIRARTYEDSNFAPQAHKIIVDIDNLELQKFTFPCEKICADAKEILVYLNTLPKFDCVEWITQCRTVKSKYPKFDSKLKKVDVYQEINTLSKVHKEESIVVANGFACIATYQSWEVKPNQRVLMNSGTASMGWALSAAIGVYFATLKPVLCIEGDGSMMMNLGSLWVIKQYNIPINLVIIDNQGYNSIKSTERSMKSKSSYGCETKDLSIMEWPVLDDIVDKYMVIYTDPNQDYLVKVASHLENGKWVSDTLDNMSPHEEDNHD